MNITILYLTLLFGLGALVTFTSRTESKIPFFTVGVFFMATALATAVNWALGIQEHKLVSFLILVPALGLLCSKGSAHDKQAARK